MQGSKNQSVGSCDYRCVIPLTSASPLEAPVDDRSTLSEYHIVGNRMAALSPEWVTCKLGVYVEKHIRATGGNPDGEYTCIMRDCKNIHVDT